MKVKNRFFEFFNTTKKVMIGGFRQTLKTTLMVEWIKYAYKKGHKVCLITSDFDKVYIKKKLNDVKIDIFTSSSSFTGVKGHTYDIVFYDEPLFWKKSFADVNLNISSSINASQYIMFSYYPLLRSPLFSRYESIARTWAEDYVEMHFGINNKIVFSGETKNGTDNDMIWALTNAVELDEAEGQNLPSAEKIGDKMTPDIIIEKDGEIIL